MLNQVNSVLSTAHTSVYCILKALLKQNMKDKPINFEKHTPQTVWLVDMID